MGDFPGREFDAWITREPDDPYDNVCAHGVSLDDPCVDCEDDQDRIERERRAPEDDHDLAFDTEREDR